ncbi:MAG: agmatine deiminase family protein [Bacteroidia bacterium]|nr:agmatine deiminase family protein [Bacteroidia bacterium]MBP7244481.1 agmatine deiminase family protein [Bacteroidia bacterium]
MKNATSLAFLLLFYSIQASSQEGHRMSTFEKTLIPSYMSSRGIAPSPAAVIPPTSPVRTIAEWEELQALVVGWKSYPTILRQIVGAAKQETRVIVVYTTPDNPTSLTSYLAAGGVDTVNVTFLAAPVNSVWSRDYGPWSAYTNDVDSLITIDWIYNRPRPSDDAVPVAISNFIGTPLYQTTTAPWNLVHTGGNFMTDGFGTGFSSALVLDENSAAGGFGINHTPAEIDSIMYHFMGINRYIIMNTLPFDQIHHIDMHMKLLDEQTLLVGQYPAGIADGPQIEANLQFVLANYNSIYGTPFKVVRVLMPDDNNLYPNNGGDYFTYTNSSFINKTIILPVYGISEDSTAIRIYRESLPGYNVVPINCASMIGALGALHCITKEVGTNDPLLISHQPLENTTDTVNSYVVNSLIQHRSGINDATLFWRTDTLMGWNTSNMSFTGIANNWSGLIPAQLVGTTVYYYIAANSVSGKSQVRPMPAPAGYWKFEVTGTTGYAESFTNEIQSIFPNPCNAMTCIPVQIEQSGTIQIRLLDASGRLIQTIFQGNKNAGENKFFFDAKNLDEGMYFIEMKTSQGVSTAKVAVRH